MERCINYCGLRCIDGTCPNALAREYPEYDFKFITCHECYTYRGCNDCYFYGREGMCEFRTKEGKVMEVKEIKIKYIRDIEKIHDIEIGDWIDLRVGRDTYIKAGELELIPLGVAMQLPKGYEALVIPRSSTFKKYGVIQANSVGLIDETYCGNNDEWHFPAYATRDILITKDTRICQFRIQKHQSPVYLKEVENLTSNDRGGFGSTGEK